MRLTDLQTEVTRLHNIVNSNWYRGEPLTDIALYYTYCELRELATPSNVVIPEGVHITALHLIKTLLDSIEPNIIARYKEAMSTLGYEYVDSLSSKTIVFNKPEKVNLEACNLRRRGYAGEIQPPFSDGWDVEVNNRSRQPIAHRAEGEPYENP